MLSILKTFTTSSKMAFYTESIHKHTPPITDGKYGLDIIKVIAANPILTHLSIR